ncbi:MAG: TolC family protein [Bryobacteraceae bacterium]|nr:TolC family protein [Bryobacteraceae bacterium]
MKLPHLSKFAWAGAISSLALAALHAESKPAPQPSVVIPPEFAHSSGQGQTPPVEWWQHFADPDLTELIRLAFQHNRDVAVARARLVESRAAVRSSARDLWPKMTPGLGFTESTRSNNSPAIPRISEANRPPGIPDLIPRRYGVFETGFDASYEFDLFGAQRDGVQAVRFDAAAQSEQLHDTLVSLAAEVTRNYWTLREAQTRLRLSARSEHNLKESLMLQAMRIEAGLAAESDRLPIEGQLASTRAAAAPLADTADHCLFALAALTGQSRGELRRLGDRPGELPQVPRTLPAGLPSELLQRRPDIRRAFAQLHAATARRHSAEKDWWPKFKLTSAFGGQSGELANLLSGGSFFSNLAPRMTWGALQFQQTKANISRQKAQEQQQLAVLEAAILTALREVDAALSSLAHERQRLFELENALAIERRRTAAATELYSAGLAHYLGVLEAERRETAATDHIVQSRAALARDLISLYKALGGGWQSAPVTPETPSFPKGN